MRAGVKESAATRRRGNVFMEGPGVRGVATVQRYVGGGLGGQQGGRARGDLGSYRCESAFASRAIRRLSRFRGLLMFVPRILFVALSAVLFTTSDNYERNAIRSVASSVRRSFASSHLLFAAGCAT